MSFQSGIVLVALFLLTCVSSQSKLTLMKLIMANWHLLGHLDIASNLQSVGGNVIMLCLVVGMGKIGDI